MISRRHRFHGYGGVRNVYRQGQATRGPLFSIKSLLNPRRRSYRLSVVVSRKVHKSAVARNRIRRRLYEAVRNLESDIIQPYDIVLTVFSDAVIDEPQEQLVRQLKAQLRQAGVLAKRVSG